MFKTDIKKLLKMVIRIVFAVRSRYGKKPESTNDDTNSFRSEKVVSAVAASDTK